MCKLNVQTFAKDGTACNYIYVVSPNAKIGLN